MSASSLNLSDEIAVFKAELDTGERELAELEQELEDLTRLTTRCRKTITDIRSLLKGRAPTHSSPIVPPQIKEGATRVGRGARLEQCRQICFKLGAHRRQFRTKDVASAMTNQDEELSPNHQSHASLLLKKLAEQGVIKKMGHGKWKLTSTSLRKLR